MKKSIQEKVKKFFISLAVASIFLVPSGVFATQEIFIPGIDGSGTFQKADHSFISDNSKFPDGKYKGDGWQAIVTGGKVVGILDVSSSGKWEGVSGSGNFAEKRTQTLEAEGIWTGNVQTVPVAGVYGNGFWWKTGSYFEGGVGVHFTVPQGSFIGVAPTAKDGHYKAPWGQNAGGSWGGKWEGTVDKGKVNGAWTAEDDVVLSANVTLRDNQGLWVGYDSENSGIDKTFVLKDTKKPTTDTSYNFLEQLPGLNDTFETDPDKDPCPFGRYLQILINLIIGICAVLAFVMIVMGGIEYMTSELVSSKEAGKDNIRNALFGLTIALCAWLILNTLNPNLLKLCLNNLPQANLTIDEEDGHYTEAEAGSIIANYGQVGSVHDSGVLESPVINKTAPIIQQRDSRSSSSIKAIVLHQTDGTSMNSALAHWIEKKGSAGAHFIIGKDGTIWQTASTNFATNSIKDVIAGGYNNTNTVSIEVVGDCFLDKVGGTRCDTDNASSSRNLKPPRTVWEPATSQQRIALTSLISTLKTKNHTISEVVAHGVISKNKTYNEGVGMYP